MVLTPEHTVPDESLLTVQEINLSYPVLHGAAFYLGKACEWENNEFSLCRSEEGDIRKCIHEGRAVTSCALKFFQDLKKHCKKEFEQYVQCLEKSSGSLDFRYCRKTQAAVDKCVLDNMNIERPGFGYFCEAKIHNTKRPKPEPERPKKYEDAVPRMPPDAKYPADVRSRHMFTE